jgi:hypothetical protein
MSATKTCNCQAAPATRTLIRSKAFSLSGSAALRETGLFICRWQALENRFVPVRSEDNRPFTVNILPE